MKYIIILSAAILFNQVSSQFLRPPYNLNRPENRDNANCKPPPPLIPEPPCNSVIPTPNPPPSTTLITDCSPSICQNLANTIQLMIVCNLLQNSRSTDLAMQLAAPILNEVMTSPALSCGCPNPIPTNFANLGPNVITPNIGQIITPNLGPNVISNFGPMINPNLVPLNSPNLGPMTTPNFAPVYPSQYSPNVISPNLPPRVVSPSPCSSNVLSGVNTLGPNALGAANANGLLNTIMSMLGNMQ